MTWTDLFSQLGVFGLGVTAVSFLCRSVIAHWLDRDVTRYRADLQRAHDLELESLRNDLRLRSIEHEIRFRSIHEKQAEVIAETYLRLYNVYSSVCSYVKEIEHSSEPSKAQKFKMTENAYTEFRQFVYPRLLYLPNATAQLVKELGNQLAGITNEFTFGLRKERHAPRSASTSDSDEDDDFWMKADKMLEEQVPPLLKRLEADFQRLLGVRATSGQ